MKIFHSLYSIAKEKFIKWLIEKEKEDYYSKKLNASTTYQNWKKYANILDNLQQKTVWKSKNESVNYDFRELELFCNILKLKRKNNDIPGLIHVLRSCLTKSFCNINNQVLYDECFLGTKNLIEEFILEREKCLIYLATAPDRELSIFSKSEFFEEAKMLYGQSALILSGGAVFGLYHRGVIMTLLDNNVLPKIICGSSAGSLSASIICCLNYSEIYSFVSRNHEDFDGPVFSKQDSKSIKDLLLNLIYKGHMLDINQLKNYYREILGDLTFKEAYQKSGRVLNISVTGYYHYQQSFLLNYISAPNVLVFSAVAASSAAPVLYGPTELLCKNEYNQIVPFSLKSNLFIDGSLSHDVPIDQVSELFNITTFIVSQVNPWVFPLIDEDHDTKNIFNKKHCSVLRLITNLIITELIHRTKQLQSIFPGLFGKFLNLVTQRYTGDITITPPINIKDFFNFRGNPKGNDYLRFGIHGSRKVFGKVHRIENLMSTELMLEKFSTYFKQKIFKEYSDLNRKGKSSYPSTIKNNFNIDDSSNNTLNSTFFTRNLLTTKESKYPVRKTINNTTGLQKKLVINSEESIKPNGENCKEETLDLQVLSKINTNYEHTKETYFMSKKTAKTTKNYLMRKGKPSEISKCLCNNKINSSLFGTANRKNKSNGKSINRTITTTSSSSSGNSLIQSGKANIDDKEDENERNKENKVNHSFCEK